MVTVSALWLYVWVFHRMEEFRRNHQWCSPLRNKTRVSLSTGYSHSFEIFVLNLCTFIRKWRLLLAVSNNGVFAWFLADPASIRLPLGLSRLQSAITKCTCSFNLLRSAQQISNECFLEARHSSRSWGYSSKQNRKTPALPGTYIPLTVERHATEVINYVW